MRRQEEGELVDSFRTSLYCLAKHCNYRDLQDEMIQDRIVVGLRDSNLLQKLQNDPKLTLDKARTMAQQTEAVREYIVQAVVRGETDNTCTRIEAVEHSYFNKKHRTMFQVSKIPKQPTRKAVPAVASFQHIQVPGS